MVKILKKIITVVFSIGFLGILTLPSVFAQQSVNVSLPAFKITMNDAVIDNSQRIYPIIVYKDITYVPMTYNDSRFLGLETKWSSDTGLQVNKISEQLSYNPDKGYASSTLESAVLPEFKIGVNGQNIDNQSEAFPILVFRDVTYFPLTWRYMVNEFGWTSSFDANNGLIINSKAVTTGLPTMPTSGKVFSQAFGSVTTIFDHSTINQPGNLSVTENNNTKKIGNPNYIYGVSYLQAGTYGQYSAVDKVEYANRWIYTVAVDPSASTITSKNVRINIDTNEVQALDGTTISNTSNSNNNYDTNQVYSKQFDNITVKLDRSSNNKPGNLYVTETTTKRIGNPKYIYGVSYQQAGSTGQYSAVDKVEYANRWVYTSAVDPSATVIVSKDVRINIDTNEVQVLDGSTLSNSNNSNNNNGYNGSNNNNNNNNNQVYSKQFGNIAVMLDHSSSNRPGNLSITENNSTRKIGNSNYIYGVSYLQAGTYGQYSAVDKVDYVNRWVYTSAVDPFASTIVSKNVRINIDTNEVQAVDGSTISNNNNSNNNNNNNNGYNGNNNNYNNNNQMYSKQFDNITVMLDRSSNKQAGNLYVKENNNTKRIGNPNYIYGVSYSRQPSETYNPVNNLSLVNRWVYVSAIDPSASPLVSKNVRINIDTNEVQLTNIVP